MWRKWYNLYLSPKKELSKVIYNLTGLPPANLHLYELALTHASARIEGAMGNRLDNERLEFLGDAVLGLVVADILFKKYPNRDEGFMTEMRSRIVNTNQLDILARKMSIDRLLQTDIKSQTVIARNKAIYADAFEALIGAFFLDHGFKHTYQFVHKRIIAQHVDFNHLQNTEHNYKSRIIEWGQKHNKKISFEVVDMQGIGLKKQFCIGLFVDDKQLSLGIDFTKKGAEQIAAEKLFEQLKANSQP